MKNCTAIVIAVLLIAGVQALGQQAVPLKLIQTIQLAPDVKGHFDHFEVDLKGNRLFATPED